MRHQGKITNWKDDQGFGFITPKSDDGKVFVHIKSFANRQRRPVGNELVVYDLNSDSRGRLQAENVAFVGERARRVPRPGPGVGAFTFAALFVIFLTWAVLVGELPLAVPGLYLIGSVVTFVAYALDKSAANNDRWRTPESTLYFLGLLGGWPGALVAQRLLRHKSRKTSFQLTFWATVLLNCIALVWLLWSPDADVLLAYLRTAWAQLLKLVSLS